MSECECDRPTYPSDWLHPLLSAIVDLIYEDLDYGDDYEDDEIIIRHYWWGDDYDPRAYSPNFIHKESGLEVWWYKHPGRGLTSSEEAAEIEESEYRTGFSWGTIAGEILKRLRREKGLG